MSLDLMTDSLPNESEIRATFFFLQKNQFFAHTMRTHTNHATPPTIMLAGLCGFRPKKIEFLEDVNFDMYYQSFKTDAWGADQNSLINLFIRDSNWTNIHFLDSPLSSADHKVNPPLIRCQSLNENFYKSNVDISNLNSDLISILNEYTKWGGEPIDIRKEKLGRLLDLDIPEFINMKNIINSLDEKIKDFYL